MRLRLCSSKLSFSGTMTMRMILSITTCVFLFAARQNQPYLVAATKDGADSDDCISRDFVDGKIMVRRKILASYFVFKIRLK